MKTSAIALALVFGSALAGCAAPVQNIIDCSLRGGCNPPWQIAELQRVAGSELKCAVDKLGYRLTGGGTDDYGPWEVRGCGVVSVYGISFDGHITRTSIIAPDRHDNS